MDKPWWLSGLHKEVQAQGPTAVCELPFQQEEVVRPPSIHFPGVINAHCDYLSLMQRFNALVLAANYLRFKTAPGRSCHFPLEGHPGLDLAIRVLNSG